MLGNRTELTLRSFFLFSSLKFFPGAMPVVYKLQKFLMLSKSICIFGNTLLCKIRIDFSLKKRIDFSLKKTK